MPLTVRAPEFDDAEALGRIHVRAWQVAYSGGLMPADYLESLSEAERASTWQGWLQQPQRPRFTRLVAALDDEIVGFALAGPVGGDVDADLGELYAINVDPDHWGTGAGSALISAAVDELHASGFESAVLWVHPDNERARRFYADRGWVDDETERREEVFGIEVPEARLSLRLDA